jgi:EAL domain-containing protein (putative c-di-GMP-specific phosphodiesterase class I)
VKNRARAIQRLRMENSLRHAIENRELELLYQPVVSMQGKVESFEALLTWHRDVRGSVPPGAFIPIAEESGLIAEIGCWVIEQVCLTGAGWRKAGCRETCISLNVSARQFEWDNFVDTVSRALESSGFPARCLELELTESCVMRDLKASAERMRQIRELGVSIAIDDFGTGYSSLSYLHKLPLDSLKIDQCFLRGIAKVGGTLPVVQSIVRLAHGMHLNVVAEGVETREELELVRLAGCDQAQGHLCGQPLHAPEVEALLERGRHALAF